MSPVLEHPTLRQQVQPLTVASYHASTEAGMIDEKTELIRGFVFNKMSKSPRHFIICQRLLKRLFAALPPGFSVRQEQPLTFADSEPEPDIAVVKGVDEDYALAHPKTALLIVEVSVSTLERDIEKIGIYSEAGVSEYWLVRPDENCVDVFTNPEAGKYLSQRRLGIGDVIESGALPGVKVELGKLLA